MNSGFAGKYPLQNITKENEMDTNDDPQDEKIFWETNLKPPIDITP